MPIIASKTIGLDNLLEFLPFFSILFAMNKSVFKIDVYYNFLKLIMLRKYRNLFCLLIISLFFSFSFGQNFNTKIIVGAERLDKYLSLIKENSVAIVANQTSMVGNVHLVDTLLSLGINVVKVFAPEHGFRGDADAGETIYDEVDIKTGIPIISLHGKKKRKPSKETLSNVDVLLFDIQDVGVRFYTYISTMHYVMMACAEQNKEIIVLDRPNPNGFYVDGPILKKENTSFIGLHPVPIVHGMTIGEYATMIINEEWLGNDLRCMLKVVKCLNYSHTDYYRIPVPTSPNLPNMNSIYLYPSLCLFEGTNVSIGRGTEYPFQIYGSPFLNSNSYMFTPVSGPGSKYPKHKGKICKGYKLDSSQINNLIVKKQINYSWLTQMYKHTKESPNFFRTDGFFKLLTGNKNIRIMLEKGCSEEQIRESYKSELLEFKKIRRKYLLYPDFE